MRTLIISKMNKYKSLNLIQSLKNKLLSKIIIYKIPSMIRIMLLNKINVIIIFIKIEE